MRILLIAPYYNGQATGEAWSTYQWVKGISERVETTVLTQNPESLDQGLSPVNAQVVSWVEPDWRWIRGPLTWAMKPGYPLFFRRARRWLREQVGAGASFDLVHQISPLALRYPCPAVGMNLQFLIGPVGGSLPTPPIAQTGAGREKWYRKLRSLDKLRLRYDPWLTKTYRDAAAVIGVAPYVNDLLGRCRPRRFELMSETGVENLASKPKLPADKSGPLRLLFVGRLIRTKGILEAIEATARAATDTNVTLQILGEGELRSDCEKLARDLGVAGIVNFHGRVPRDEVDRHYRESHVFLFPSFREPSGNVVFEALSHAMPTIAVDYGGPGHVIDGTCGIKVAPTNREAFVAEIASAIRQLASDADRYASLSTGAIARMRETALWSNKWDSMLRLYRTLGAS